MRRTLLYLAAWFAAGVAAVLLAGAGLGMVGRQVTGSRPAPLSAEQVRDGLAADAATTTSTTATTAPTTTTAVSTTSTTVQSPTDGGPAGSSTTTTTPVPTPPSTTRTYELVGGTVTVRFSSAGGASLVSAVPKPGFTVDVSGSHSNGVRVEFETDDHESRLDAWWDGAPQDEVREED